MRISEKRKVLLVGILLVILSIVIFIVGPSFLDKLTPISASIINSNRILSYIYKYWKIEDVAVLVIGIICIISSMGG